MNARTPDPDARIEPAAWAAAMAALERDGHATLPRLLDAGECRTLGALAADDAPFRKRVVMQQHGYGQGSYQYFRYPLPDLVARLRASLYERLAPVANAWRGRLGESGAYPPTLEAFLTECRAAGQTRPTPLLLRYEAGDYNCLHQDLYGALAFPIQATVLLSAPGADFEGGEFLLVEQRPRRQSMGRVVPLAQGDAVLFAVRHRPALGTRGWHRVTLRHGVSPLRSGLRQTLGLIFHDAA
ncbi:MAG: 2OG-Fe(II) oxygenase [Alphaproteobacteria bacterium]|nr:2OG-Fe(II) oxygenase [Alphaproteobacteria bacterium]